MVSVPGSCFNIPVKSVDETLAFSSVRYPLLTHLVPQNPISRFFCLFKDLLRNIILPSLTCTFLFYGNFFFLGIHKGLNESFILKSVSWIKIM